MPAIKLRELRGGGRDRHLDIWKLLGERGLCARKVKDGQGVYFLIVAEADTEKFLSEDNVKYFREQGFEM